jgi:hypothetical protein
LALDLSIDRERRSGEPDSRLPRGSALSINLFAGEHLKMTHFTYRLLAATLLASSSMAAQAQEPSYSYLEGGFSLINVDAPGSSTETGFFAGLSTAMGEVLYLTASYEQYDVDRGDLNLFKAGLGFRTAMNSNTDLNFEIGYDRLEAGFDDFDGFRGTVGLRSAHSQRFQSRAYAGYSTDDDFDDGDFLIGLEGNVLFNDRVAMTFQAETFEFDVNFYRLGLRFMY